MAAVTFVVPGKPFGKQRPNFSKVGKYVRTYTPDDTVNYETYIKILYKQEAGERYFDKGTPLRILIVALYEIPKSTSKRKAARMRAGELRPTGRPDTDNIAKVICDGLNKIAYYDDAQVVELKVVKYYSDTPSVTVTVEEVTEDDSKANDN